MPRKTHPKREVEEALKYAEGRGWRIDVGGSHAWGRIYCPYTMKAADAESFVLRAFGVRLVVLRIMSGKFGESCVTASDTRTSA